MSVISQVEDAIKSGIKAALPGVLRETGTLPGAWDTEIARRVLQGAPSVWVSFEGFERPAENPPGIVDARFGVYPVAKEGTEEQRRRGTAVTIGLYEMSERLVAELDGLMMSGLGTLWLSTARPLFVEQMLELGGSVHGLLFTIRLKIKRRDPADLADFRQFHADYDFAPFNPEPYPEWLEDEDYTTPPDAQDDVEIPQS